MLLRLENGKDRSCCAVGPGKCASPHSSSSGQHQALYICKVQYDIEMFAYFSEARRQFSLLASGVSVEML